MSHLRNATASAGGPHSTEQDVFRSSPYGGDKVWRQRYFREILATLTRHHYENCSYYRNILVAIGFDPTLDADLSDLPFLPVGLFKQLDLVSVSAPQVSRILSSSGTRGAARSRVFLDRETSILQMRALATIVGSFVVEGRLPVLIIDASRVPDDEGGYAARAVAIQGFSLFGGGRIAFALTEKMQPDLEKIEEFLKDLGAASFLMFGFTYVIWRHLLEHLAKNNVRLDFTKAVLIHGGGWKRLTDEHITDDVFKRRARERTGLTRIHNYYGMVEQPGSIYMQCEHGFMHCSNFSQILIRRVGDLSVANLGEPGLIQTLSILPRSYPGHNLLTEDMGILHGEDDCRCGRKGKYFEILGRLPAAEPRGCGDTYVSAR